MRLQVLQRHVGASTKGAKGVCGNNSSRFGSLPPMKKNLASMTSSPTTNRTHSSVGKLTGCGKRNFSSLTSSVSSSVFGRNCDQSAIPRTSLVSSSMTSPTTTIICRVPKTVHTTSRRRYVITSTSTTSNSDDSKSNNTADAMGPTAMSSIPKDKEQEMDKLLATALIEAKEISALAMQRKINRSKNSLSCGKNFDETIQELMGNNSEMVPSDITANSSKNKSDEKVVPPSMPSSNDSIHTEVRAAKIKIEIQDEINAAEALLRLTDNPIFRMALKIDQERSRKTKENHTSLKNDTDVKDSSRNDTNNNAKAHNVVQSLHSAFILVINWLSSSLASCPPPGNHPDRDVVNFPSQLPPTETSMTTHPPSASSFPMPTKGSMLLAHILDLHERSRLLDLPLTIPQYQTIAKMIARHSSNIDLPIRILDVYTDVADIYGKDVINPDDEDDMNAQEKVIQSQFFDGALKELLERNKMRDMIEIFHGMKGIHNIHDIDPQIGIELLTILKKKVDDSVAGVRSMGFDEVDAMELTTILEEPVMEALDSRRKELVHYQRLLGESVDSLFEYENDIDVEEDDHDVNAIVSKDNISEVDEIGNKLTDSEIEDIKSNAEDGNVAIDEDENKLEKLVKIWGSSDASEEEREAAIVEATQILNKMMENRQVNERAQDAEDKSDGQISSSDANPLGITARFHVDNETGEVENIELSFSPKPTPFSDAQQKGYDRMQSEVMKCMIYARDSSFDVPDVVDQLEAWNNGISLQFTEEYEAELVKEISEENDAIFDSERDEN